MMARIRDWWAQRTEREQVMLGIMAAFLALFAAWFAVVAPLRSALDSAKFRHETAVIDIATVKTKAAAYQALMRDAPASPAAPLASLVSQSATEAGFGQVRLDSVSTNEVKVAISSARSPALLAWIAALDRQGIFVRQLSIRANGDATVSVDVTFAAGGL